MKKKPSVFAFFMTAASLFALVAGGLVTFIAIDRTNSSDSFPSYSYNQYVNQTKTGEYSDDLGGQLYEAEDLSLTGDCKIIDSVSASGCEAVSNLKNGSSISMTVTSASSTLCMFTIHSSYVSSSKKSIEANHLFSLILNGNEIALTSQVQSNYNEYDFIDNDIAALHLNEGKNTISLVSLTDLYKIDYLALKSRYKPEADRNVIADQYFEFDPNDARQVFEAENMSNNGSLVVNDLSASGTFASYFSNPEDTLNCFISSAKEAETSLNVKIRAAQEGAIPQFEVKVNGTAIEKDETDISFSYFSLDYGSISLSKGENSISIRAISGSFYVDYLSLNNEINHSSKSTNEAFEAEEAQLFGEAQIISSSSASGGKAVGYLYIDSYAEFSVNSKIDDTVSLYLSMSYVGLTQNSDRILETSVNDVTVDTSANQIRNTGGYHVYDTFYLGSIHLTAGKNTIRIYSFTGNFNLDTMILGKEQFTGQSNSLKTEMESILINQGAYGWYSINASGEKCVANNVSSSYLDFFFVSDSSRLMTLSFVLSLGNSQGIANDYFALEFNSSGIDISGVSIPTLTRYSVFEKIEVGVIELSAGMNHLRIVNKKAGIYFDYLTLEK
ncbi:MAG: hypothetical protein WCR67_03365 [Bacilli bacterium]